MIDHARDHTGGPKRALLHLLRGHGHDMLRDNVSRHHIKIFEQVLIASFLHFVNVVE